MNGRQKDLDERVPEVVVIGNISSAPFGFRNQTTGKYEIEKGNPKPLDTNTAGFGSNLAQVCEEVRQFQGYSNFRVEHAIIADADEQLKVEYEIILIGLDVSEKQIGFLQDQIRIAVCLRSPAGQNAGLDELYQSCSAPVKIIHEQLRVDFLKKKSNSKIATPISISCGEDSIFLKDKFADFESCQISKTDKAVHGVVEILDKKQMLCGLRFQEKGDQSAAIKSIKVSFNVSKFWTCLYAALGNEEPLEFLLKQQIEITEDGSIAKVGKWSIHDISDPLIGFTLG